MLDIAEVVNESRLITCVDRAVSPYEHPEYLKELAETETLEFIFSNTIEAGIALTNAEKHGVREMCIFKTGVTL